MNANLIAATLVQPTPLTASPWGGASQGGDGDPSGAAFSRLLDSARQGAAPTNEPPRPSAQSREAEGVKGGERGERSEPADRPANAAESRDDGEDAAPRSANASSRPSEGSRRSSSSSSASSAQAAAQAAARRDGASAHAAARSQRGATAGAADTAGGEGSGGSEGDQSDPVQGRTTRAAGDAAAHAATDTAAVPLADAAAATRPLPSPDPGAAAANAATVGEGRPARAAAATSGGDLHALLQGIARSAGGSAAGPDSEAAGRARGQASFPPPGNESAAAAGALDPAHLGLQAAAGDTHASLGAAESGRLLEGFSATLGAAGTSGTAGTGGTGGAAGTTHLPSGAFAGVLGAAAGAGALDVASITREAGLTAAPGSEGFARELGAQVSVFVREGVQQARLHLNPQELGPVLVRIQLEGQAAQVHLAAELQATRQALEQALPALASQLSEAGLTLSGGGVFEQPPQGFGERDAADAEDRRGATGTDARTDAATGTAPAAAASRWSQPRGLVDLVA